MSSADDSLESVGRSLAFSSLIFLPYSNRAATAAALSWESSLDSSRVLGLPLSNIGSSINISRKESRAGRGVSGLDDEDCLGLALIAVGGCRLPPWPPVLVMSLRCWDPGWASALGGEDPP